MSGPAVGSRLLELRREREAARRGRDVMEQKLELLRRELLRRRAQLLEVRARTAVALAEARKALRAAHVELGEDTVAAAALAQPPSAQVFWRSESTVGVPVVKLTATAPAFKPRYGPAGTAASLDQAGVAWSAAVPLLVLLASEEAAVRALRRGLAKTGRRLNALEKAILPQLDAQIREGASAIEEQDREESVRRRSWLELEQSR